MTPIFASLLVLSATMVFLFRIRTWVARRKANPMGLPYPPGPKPYPLLGNVFDLPASYYWLMYAEWHKIYGDIVHIEAFGRRLIILNSREACTDLLEKRSSIYSDKPYSIMLSELWAFHKSLFTNFRCESSTTEWVFLGLLPCCHMDRCGDNTGRSINNTSTAVLSRNMPRNSWQKPAKHYTDSLKSLMHSETTLDCALPSNK